MNIFENLNIFGSKDKPEITPEGDIKVDNSEFVDPEVEGEIETPKISESELAEIEEKRKLAAEQLGKKIKDDDFSDLTEITGGPKFPDNSNS